MTEQFPVESSLQHREALIAAREADLRARRREAASVIRRQRRQSVQLDSRLAEISSLMSELAQAVLQSNAVLHEQAAWYTQQADSQEGTLRPARETDTAAEQQNAEARLLIDELTTEVQSLREQIESLEMQNEQLAGDLAQANVRRSISTSSDGDATLTWEQRKAMLFAQDLAPDPRTPSLGPQLDNDRSEELERNVLQLRQDIERRDAEINQLRDLLEQRPTHCEDGMAVGAAAIAQFMDGDELIVEERKRLQDLQAEWESRFRQMEIAASIERASLARERQTLERRNVELEEQMAHLKRELRQDEITGPNQSRRWLAKLGLAE
jgi:hypothetical protein